MLDGGWENLGVPQLRSNGRNLAEMEAVPPPEFSWSVSGSVSREWRIWMHPTSPPLGRFILDRQIQAIEECVDDLELFHFEGGKEARVRVELAFP